MTSGIANTVLAASDFSESADLALEASVRWAGDLGAQIRLLHVLDPWKESLGEASRQLAERSVRVNEAGIDCCSELISRCGTPPDADDLPTGDASCVFIGTHGQSGFRKLAVGSWADAVVRSSACPVVTVSQGARLSKTLSTIAVGADGSDPSNLVLEQLRAVGAALGCTRFVLVHAETRTAAREVAAANFASMLRALRGDGYRAELVMADATAADLLLRVAREESADLIALGTHSRRGFPQLMFGSVAKEVIQKSKCPVYTARWATRERKS